MNCRVMSTTFIASCGLALALAAAGCADNREAGVEGTGAQSAGHEGAPITLTGCLQKGSGMNNFILTQVNEPSGSTPVTKGGDDAQARVEREQLRAARHVYRLSGDNDDFENLVGKQVRVTGTVEENSELQPNAGMKSDRDAVGTAGDENRNAKNPPADREKVDDRTAAERERVDIDAGDLAEVDVQRVEMVAEACGQAVK
jgi:hypothetical protein